MRENGKKMIRLKNGRLSWYTDEEYKYLEDCHKKLKQMKKYQGVR